MAHKKWYRGAQYTLTAQLPAAGKEFAIEIPEDGPEGVRYEPIAFLAVVSLSGAVANRNFNFFAENAAHTRYARWGSPNSEVAGATVEFVHFPDADRAILINPTRKAQQGSMPRSLYMEKGHRIVSETGLMDAADQWSDVRVLVQEWLFVEE